MDTFIMLRGKLINFMSGDFLKWITMTTPTTQNNVILA